MSGAETDIGPVTPAEVIRAYGSRVSAEIDSLDHRDVWVKVRGPRGGRHGGDFFLDSKQARALGKRLIALAREIERGARA